MNRSLFKHRTVLLISIIVVSTLLVPLQSATHTTSPLNNPIQHVTLDDATQVAETMISSHGKQKTHTIHQMDTIYDETGEKILAYLFTLTPQGYIVIPNSYQLKPVLAYSFINDASADQINCNPFINLVQKDIDTRMKFYSLNSDKIDQHHLLLWEQQTEKTMIGLTSQQQEQWPPEGSTSTGGWIETTWHQNAPYKNFCPIDTTTDKRSVAGCPALAMAQILNYHQTINNVHFDNQDDYEHEYLETYWIDNDYKTYDFPSFPQLNTYLQNVTAHFDDGIPLTDDDKAALVFACGVGAEQVYSSQVSGTFGIDQIYQSYQKFNCNNAILLKDDTSQVYEEIIEDIKNAQPVHFAVVNPSWTSGHNLIIDGYRTDGYFHLNYGFGGRYDGWYDIPQQIPFDLTVFEGVVVNIMDHLTHADLATQGSIVYADVKAGTMLSETIQVINNGEPGSSLQWSIESVPNWGTWNITPSQQIGLTPEEGPYNVTISVILPDEKGESFNGGITVINDDNPGDKSIIPITITTSKTKYDHPFNLHFFQWHRLIQWIQLILFN